MSKININEQTPAGVNSYKETKPYISKTKNKLEGYVGNSWNGGMIKPIAYKKVMAGEKIDRYTLKGMLRMLTPKVPSAQKLKAVFKAFYVPNSRIWEGSEEYMAQKGGMITKITKQPSLFDYLASDYNATIPLIAMNTDNNKFIPITDSLAWRDGWQSTYIPRLATTYKNTEETSLLSVPDITVLHLRGLPAIYNDMLRHKAYDEPLQEFKGNTVSETEFNRYFPNDLESLGNNIIRGRRQDSYYTNYKTSLLGFNAGYNSQEQDVQTHAEWQKLISENRAQSGNQQRNDWDIIAEIRGTRPVRDGKVRFLGERVVGINYQQVAQTSYNEGPTIEEFQTLGATGAYSYTEFAIDLINYEEFIEEGYIHIIQQTSADTVFSTGIDRQLMNVKWNDEYRPDLKELIDDILYMGEANGTWDISMDAKWKDATGFKRKFSENFKLPTILNGDITNTEIYETESMDKNGSPAIITNKEFMFSELSNAQEIMHVDGIQGSVYKNIWQDYTDLLINRNQAIQNKILFSSNIGETDYRILGANQIFMVALAECVTNMPIDDKIKNDFKTWGEM